MIKNYAKIEKCRKDIKSLCEWLASIYPGLTINSGYRTEQENAAAGGVKGSYHTMGIAVDLSAPYVSAIKIAAKVLDNIQKFPVRGIGLDIYKNYVHVDYRPSKEIVFWVYGVNGKQA